MKSFISLLMAVVLAFTLTACGGSAGTESGGTQASNNAFADYAGVWGEADASKDSGGLVFNISVGKTEMDFTATLVSPDGAVAEFAKKLVLSEISNNTATAKFEDEKWGSSGDMEITFNGSFILVDFKNVTVNEMASWGFRENTYKLIKNDAVLDIIPQESPQKPTQGPSGTGNQQVPNTPTYDPSKASGILAKAGLTEQEFRDMCTPLRGDMVNNYGSAEDSNSLEYIDKYDLSLGKQYFADNPQDNGVGSPAYATNQWNKICEDYKEKEVYWDYTTDPSYDGRIHYYEKYQTLDNYLNEQVYAKKGYSVIYKDTKDLIKKMREYPNDYLGQCFVLIDPPKELYDSNFAGAPIAIYDLRDDPQNPNIIKSFEYKYYFYVTFAGTHAGYDGLTLDFNLLSLEKIEQ